MTAPSDASRRPRDAGLFTNSLRPDRTASRDFRVTTIREGPSQSSITKLAQKSPGPLSTSVPVLTDATPVYTRSLKGRLASRFPKSAAI